MMPQPEAFKILAAICEFNPHEVTASDDEVVEMLTSRYYTKIEAEREIQWSDLDVQTILRALMKVFEKNTESIQPLFAGQMTFGVGWTDKGILRGGLDFLSAVKLARREVWKRTMASILSNDDDDKTAVIVPELDKFDDDTMMECYGVNYRL